MPPASLIHAVIFHECEDRYCNPYSAYEKGMNGNINKMIRRFLPKGTDFRKATAAYIRKVEEWINNYPHKVLGFKTSENLLNRYLAESA